LLLAAVFVLAAGSRALAVETQPGEVEAKFDSRFSPQRLSPRERTLVSPWVSMRFKPSEYSRVPALEGFEIEEDRHLRLNLEGVPVCRPGNADEPPMEKRCRNAVIGAGKMITVVSFPELTIPPLQDKLTVYNAGLKDGVRTFLLGTTIPVPAPKEIVIVVKVKQSDLGRYGLKLVGSVPKIVGGSGSITSLAWWFHRSVVSATCSVGHLNTGFTTTFVDGTRLLGKVTRPCTPVP
jgi:hypothetical protein